MDSENYQGYNIRQPENHFSFFGRKVYNVMLQHYRAGVSGVFTPGKNLTHLDKNNVSRYETSGERRGEGNNAETGSNLNFSNIKINYKNAENDLENPESLITLSDDSRAVFSGVVNETIPKTIELLKSAHDNIIPNNTHFHITPHSDTAADSQPIFSFKTRKDNDCYFIPHLTDLGKQLSHEYIDLGKQIAWEDMGDSEMFKVDDNFDKTDKAQIKKTIENKDFRKDNISIGLTSQEIKLNESNQTLSDNTNKVDQATKKVKKVAKTIEKKSKTNLLKRKYTKAVKNWLNNIDPPHSVDSIDLQADTINSNEESNTIDNPDTLQNSLKFVEVKHTCKKMVQSQLTNDNGIMKFYKPNCFSNANKIFGDENCTAVQTSKTNKRKFIAPIKSQNLP